MKIIQVIGLCLLLTACGRNERLEQALEFAGENRVELEKESKVQSTAIRPMRKKAKQLLFSIH